MRYYRLIGGNQTFRETEGVFMPFDTAIGLEYRNQGSTSCNGGRVDPGYDGLLRSECIWIQYWAQLSSAAERESYGDYLAAYIGSQKELGRFPREPAYRLHPLMSWLEERGVVGRDTRLQAWLAFGFLLVCLVNTVGLMLAKFTAKAGEVGVRRAVGATRTELFQQLLVEAGVVGLAGGLAGLVLSFGGLWLIGRQSQSIANIATMNMQMLAGALALALAASLLAGLLPTWRAVQVRPALQLKSQ
jgi:putative ABC transport system permease protein